MLKTIIIFFILCTSCLADELQIPLPCWPQQLKEEFEKGGLILDLDSGQRTKDSWGYLVNKGSNYIIYTYGVLQPNDFGLIQEIVFKVDGAMK